MNAFMVFNHLNRQNVMKENPGLTGSQVSKKLGMIWNQLDVETQEIFFQEAERLRILPRQENPGVRFQPQPKPKEKPLKRNYIITRKHPIPKWFLHPLQSDTTRHTYTIQSKFGGNNFVNDALTLQKLKYHPWKLKNSGRTSTANLSTKITIDNNFIKEARRLKNSKMIPVLPSLTALPTSTTSTSSSLGVPWTQEIPFEEE